MGNREKMEEVNYSVLMSVYYKERPAFLRAAMESILTQTVQTDNFVLVCDGPLTEALNLVLDEMSGLFGETLLIVRLKENSGLGNALNEGMKYCRNDLVARMDSDDISRPDRCERQLAVFAKQDVDIVSGTVEEFTETPDVVDAKRVLPETQEKIIYFAKKRNPFNHPCVMYKKSAVLAAGGYQDFYLLEDYYLWIRMLLKGCKGYNILAPLLWMRGGSDMYKRRSGWRYAASQRALFRFMYESKWIGKKSYLASCAIRTASACAPNWLRKGLFQKILRK